MENRLAALNNTPTSIDGALLFSVPSAVDSRGTLGVVSRADWPLPALLQWNLVQSSSSVVRGFHVHVRHVDWVVATSGTLHVGLRDLRIASATYGCSEVIALAPFSGALLIPPGVGHAFVSAEPTTHLYATDEYWDPTDEFGCRWDDSALGLDWPPIHEPLLSERDAASGSYAQLEVLLRSHVL